MKVCDNCKKEEGCKIRQQVYMNGMNSCSEWQEPKILVGIPCMETVPTRFAISLVGLDKPEGTEFMFVVASLIQHARDGIADYAIKNGFDYVLWLDSDMTFSADILYRLLRDKKDIVSGLYYKRQLPKIPVIYEKTDGGFIPMMEIPEGMFRADAVGMGCTLMKTEALKKVREGGEMFSPYTRMGEDLSFCVRAKKAGLEIWCDPEIKCGHLTMMEVK